MRSPLAIAVLWAVLMPGLAVLSLGLVFKFAPQVMWGQAGAYIYPGSSGEFSHIVFRAREGRRGVWTEAEVTIWGNYGDAHTVVDLTTMQVRSASPVNANAGTASTGPGNTSPQPVTGAEVLNWFGYAGADVTNQALIDEADEIALIIRDIPIHQMVNPQTSHVTYFLRSPPVYGPPMWMMLAVALFWGCMIIGGLITHILLACRP